MATTHEEKKIKLIRYAEKLPLNDFPGLTAIMSIDSCYIRASNNMLHLLGYLSQKKIFDTAYANIPFPVRENAANFEKEDQIALAREIKTISYNHFSDWKILLGCKKAIQHQNEVIGLFTNFIDITSANILDVGKFFLDKNQCILQKQFSLVIIESDNDFHALTQQEQACLFYYVRGSRLKEIAYKLSVGITTVQTYIERIKHKLNVITRPQLIEKALCLGFLSIIPRLLLK